MAERIDSVVIGAGVVGLAVARMLALTGRDVVVLEAADAIGTGISARNSEVIHAGLYYTPGSLKSRSCVAGKYALYDYCAAHGVPHRRCGKLVVATNEAEAAKLTKIRKTAAANGVTDLVWMDGDAVAARAPVVHAVAALHSPSTGIVDSHSLMLAFQGDAEAAGAMIAFNTPVTGGTVAPGGGPIRIETGGETPMSLEARQLVNCAGLYAQEVAGALQGLPADSIPRRYLSRGVYFVLAGKSPFDTLIYPVPVDGGLGVHVTLDMGGQCRFGPDVESIDRIDYTLDPSRADRFYTAIRRYWPDLPDGALQPGYTGVRPRLVGPGAPPLDFLLQGPDTHGVSGLVMHYGIESPGLTSSLALAEETLALLDPPTKEGRARLARVG